MLGLAAVLGRLRHFTTLPASRGRSGDGAGVGRPAGVGSSASDSFSLHRERQQDFPKPQLRRALVSLALSEGLLCWTSCTSERYKATVSGGEAGEDPSNPCVSERPNPRAFATPTRRSTWRSRHRQTGCTEPMMFAVVRQSGLLKTEDSSRRFTKTSKASTSALRTRELDPCCPLQHCHRQVVFGTASRGTCRTNHVDVTTKHLAVLTCRNLQALLHLEQRVVRTVDTAGSQVVTLQNPVRLNTPFIASGFTDWTPLNTAHSRCSLLGNPGQTLPNKAL